MLMAMSSRFSSTASAEPSARFRAGSLFGAVATPCFVPPSIVGNVPHVTPDNLNKLPDLTTQVVDYADVEAATEFLKKHKLAMRDFLQLRDLKLVVSARDYIKGSNPPSSKSGFLIATPQGRRVVTPPELMEVATMLEAELVVPLADEIACSFGQNRQRNAVRTTLEWLDACLEAQVKPEKDEDKTPMVCGVIVGGADERLRRQSAEETVKRDVHALLVSGLESCEDATKRQTLLDTVLDAVVAQGDKAKSLPRFLTGTGHPLDVLRAVRSGIDAFISPFPSTVTQDHAALVFWMDASVDDTRVREMERQRSGSVLHLREKRFEKDFAPLLVDCDCYTCRHYTRAYVHHLLNVREMLGDTLLYLHNMHHYYRFFRVIRSQIESNTFMAYVETFVAKYEEKETTSPPLPVPMAIAERQDKKDAEKAERARQRAAVAAKAAAEAKAKAAQKVEA
ncbi:hypothetical protein Poli38472_010250 [Pythium oligandrum]|uniref:Queuine tRNA-ribosyltransferase accessory subunit 2 n=1 Tax=Pythium oligandrum TaxID=41045 RepID=A0A8K1C956_PYTOL|nr:hypothetical protein Poli38472_010250 [Pythium oligandrum]|eukprot:TMW58691.1 hypothetical protein Poli38472_010250 [Pythium oligandrum]